MEFKFSINNILKEEITKIGTTLTVPGFRGDKREVRELRRQLSEMLNTIGERSAIVQGLNKTITTAEKLENATDQTVYLLKDSRGNNGKGELIGLLKVGLKSLYLADPTLGKVKQVYTLCILDFYVIETRQRSGYGKYLFDFMLKDQKINPSKLAIDAPSPKLIAFMEKHYGVSNMVKQMNNYAIGPNFFSDAELEKAPNVPDHGNSHYRPSSRNSSGHSTPSMSQLSYGRFAAPRPACSIASVIHGEVLPETANASCPPAVRTTSMRDPVGYDVERWDEPEDLVMIPDVEEFKRNVALAAAVRPSSLPVEPEPEEHLAIEVEGEDKASSEPRSVSPAGSSATRRDSQLTEQGYFDIKFYHVKLW